MNSPFPNKNLPFGAVESYVHRLVLSGISLLTNASCHAISPKIDSSHTPKQCIFRSIDAIYTTEPPLCIAQPIQSQLSPHGQVYFSPPQGIAVPLCIVILQPKHWQSSPQGQLCVSPPQPSDVKG